MYKPQILILLYFILPIWIMAQPVISEEIIPSFEDSIALVKCSPANFQENLFGADQTWDFSGLTAEPMEPDYYFKFLDPALTLHTDRYPNSILAAINKDSQYVYYVLENGVLQLVGAAIEDETVGTAFADYNTPETEEVFPISFENTWTNNFDGTNVLGTFSAPFSGTIEGVVDAYGTLILPTGTFNNVLRIKEERTYQVTGGPVASSTMYRYLSADYKLWLLTMESFNSGSPIIYYRIDPEISTSNKTLDISNAIQIKPNPVRLNQSIYLESNFQKLERLRLFDSKGEQVSINYRDNGNSIFEIQLLNKLSTGLYFLTGVSDEGYFTKKIVLSN